MSEAMTVSLTATPSSSGGALDLLLNADATVQFVLICLLGMSIACWVIIFAKSKSINRATNQSQEFLEVFWGSKRLDHVYEQTKNYPDSPIAEVFRAGYVELNKLSSMNKTQGGNMSTDLGATENVERSLRRATSVEMTALEHRIPFLATTGSTAPFIGLFGTVWGILRAFQKIGETGSASIEVVGPDIAHALIATAVGLAAAIPAVIAYNHFNTRLGVLAGEIDNFSSDFLNIVKRHFRSA
jgi:biopolymer transport protein TolQ